MIEYQDKNPKFKSQVTHDMAGFIWVFYWATLAPPYVVGGLCEFDILKFVRPILVKSGDNQGFPSVSTSKVLENIK